MRSVFIALIFCLFTVKASAQTDTSATGPNASSVGSTQGWDICNETSYALRFASAFIRDDRMQAAGWNIIHPGACSAVTTPRNSPRFLYAESLPIHRGGIREWKGTVELCASDAEFTSEVSDDCPLKNLETRDYFAVDPAEVRTAFIEPGDFGPKAEIAGLQRLLQDSGYTITRVDGLSGRRTLRTITKAKSDLKIEKSATNQDLMKALIPAAETSRAAVGLDVCNDGTNKMFGAIAIQQDGNWTSRGWWPIEVGACIKPYDNSLIGTQAHVFALQEAFNEEGQPLPDRRLRSEVVTPAPFCIAEARFAALGREKCLEQGYAAVDFRPVPSDADGQVIRLTDVDFIQTNSDGLRR